MPLKIPLNIFIISKNHIPNKAINLIVNDYFMNLT